jgi:hypothetical protein
MVPQQEGVIPIFLFFDFRGLFQRLSTVHPTGTCGLAFMNVQRPQGSLWGALAALR